MGPKRSSDQLSTLTATPIEQIAANGTPRRQSREAIALVQEQRAVRSEDREFGAPCVCGAENFQRVIVERPVLAIGGQSFLMRPDGSGIDWGIS